MDDGPDATPILASDAERERAVVRLRDAVGEGRLTLEEFAQRVDLAQVARTDAQLAELHRDLPAAAATSAEVSAVPAQHRAICSHLIREGPWSLAPVSAWRSLFGTVDLDLREARLQSPDTRLEVHNTFGTVTVLVPEGIEVVVEGGGPFASQKIESPKRPPATGPGRVRITIDCRGMGGTLYVRTRPTVGFSIKRALGR